jgi:hypothetical protein
MALTHMRKNLPQLFHALLIATAAVCGAAYAADSPTPRVFLLDAAYLQSVRQRLQSGDTNLAPALGALEKEAEKDLSSAPLSIVNKKMTPPSGDKHDYMSMAPYFWPNPESSNGLPYIRRDGERNAEIGKIPDHHTMDEMASRVETLALAYYFTDKEVYGEKAAQFLRTWFLAPETRMNSNLQYAQSISGVNTGRGIGLIESRCLTRVVDAVGLLETSRSWTEADDRGLKEWFANFLSWMQESANGRAENAAKNNHGTFYDVQAGSYALFLGKTNMAEDILKTARQKRIALQIEPDGRQPLELVRTKAWGYSIGNLSGLMLLATLGDVVGVDLWNFRTEDGRSISKALDYLVPFALEKKQWTYQQLGEWPPQALYPLVRTAALKYPRGQYRSLLTKITDVTPANRINLLSPKPDERDSAEKKPL